MSVAPLSELRRSCSTHELIDCPVYQAVEEVWFDHRAVDQCGDSLHRREQNNTNLLRVSLGEIPCLLPFHNQLMHQSEGGNGGRHHHICAQPVLAGKHEFQQCCVFGGKPDVRRDGAPETRSEIFSRCGKRRAQHHIQSLEALHCQCIEQGLSVREVTARGGVADAHFPGELSQGQVVCTVLAQGMFGSGEQSRTELSVVVGRSFRLSHSQSLIDVVVDNIVVTGYICSMSSFSVANMPTMTGRTAVVTGANSGIGRVTARMLASKGARTVVAVRDLTKGRDAAAAMVGDVEVRRLDLADLSSVREFVENFDEPIDLLINNAGLMAPPLGRTKDGFELQFGTNHLGHFALTNLLLPRIRGRVVTVSSNGHRAGSINFQDPNWEQRPYSATRAYGQSKLANLLFTSELQRRLTEASSPILATAAHPGMASTNLLRPPGRRPRSEAVQQRIAHLLAQSDDDGALPTLYAAVADIPGNSYAGPRGFLQGRGAPELVTRSRKARDGDLAHRLWKASEELTGVAFQLAQTGESQRLGQ